MSHLLTAESVPVKKKKGGNSEGARVCWVFFSCQAKNLLYSGEVLPVQNEVNPSFIFVMLIQWKSSFDLPVEDGYFPRRKPRGNINSSLRDAYTWKLYHCSMCYESAVLGCIQLPEEHSYSCAKPFLFQITNSSLVGAADGFYPTFQIPQPGEAHPHGSHKRAAAVYLSPYPFFRFGLRLP